MHAHIRNDSSLLDCSFLISISRYYFNIGQLCGTTIKGVHTAPNERVQIGLDAVDTTGWRMVVCRVVVCILHVGHVCECAMLPRDTTLLFIDVAAPIFFSSCLTPSFSSKLLSPVDHWFRPSKLNVSNVIKSLDLCVGRVFSSLDLHKT